MSHASLGLFLTPNSSLPLSLAQIERNEASERQEEAGRQAAAHHSTLSLSLCLFNSGFLEDLSQCRSHSHHIPQSRPRSPKKIINFRTSGEPDSKIHELGSGCGWVPQDHQVAKEDQCA